HSEIWDTSPKHWRYSRTPFLRLAETATRSGSHECQIVLAGYIARFRILKALLNTIRKGWMSGAKNMCSRLKPTHLSISELITRMPASMVTPRLCSLRRVKFSSGTSGFAGGTASDLKQRLRNTG